jgi:hypothetical protein
MITIRDNFIKDEKLLRDIANDNTFFADPGVYYWWKGWFNEEPGHEPTVKQRLIEAIWANNCPVSEVWDIAGFEYWTGIQSANPTLGHKDNLGFHFDKDESWFKKTNGEEIVRPVIGTVYYPPQPEFEGGELIVHTAGKDKAPDVIQTRPNRLIIFRAGDDVHAVDTVTKGTRKAIAINLWSDVPFAKTNGDLVVEQV